MLPLANWGGYRNMLIKKDVQIGNTRGRFHVDAWIKESRNTDETLNSFFVVLPMACQNQRSFGQEFFCQTLSCDMHQYMVLTQTLFSCLTIMFWGKVLIAPSISSDARECIYLLVSMKCSSYPASKIEDKKPLPYKVYTYNPHNYYHWYH